MPARSPLSCSLAQFDEATAKLATIERTVERAAGTGKTALDRAALAAEAMLPFLPEDPAHFMILGNAFIDVGFGGPEIVFALELVRSARLQAQHAAGVAAIDRELARYRPLATAHH